MFFLFYYILALHKRAKKTKILILAKQEQCVFQTYVILKSPYGEREM